MQQSPRSNTCILIVNNIIYTLHFDREYNTLANNHYIDTETYRFVTDSVDADVVSKIYNTSWSRGITNTLSLCIIYNDVVH